jgi:hypothetical protein
MNVIFVTQVMKHVAIFRSQEHKYRDLTIIADNNTLCLCVSVAN